jgi:hypothetical protein
MAFFTCSSSPATRRTGCCIASRPDSAQTRARSGSQLPSDTGQTTHSAPALVIYRNFDGEAGITANFLVAVFIADDPSNRLLYSTLDLNKWAADQSTAWSAAQQVPGESAREVYACATTGEPGAPGAAVYVYFLANDDTGRILVASFTLEQ